MLIVLLNFPSPQSLVCNAYFIANCDKLAEPMEETISISSSGNASVTSDDFEMLDPASPNSPITQTTLPSVSQNKNSASVNEEKLPINSKSKSKFQEPKLDIANNGNIEDLHKQMSEVRKTAFCKLYNSFHFIC